MGQRIGIAERADPGPRPELSSNTPLTISGRHPPSILLFPLPTAATVGEWGPIRELIPWLFPSVITNSPPHPETRHSKPPSPPSSYNIAECHSEGLFEERIRDLFPDDMRTTYDYKVDVWQVGRWAGAEGGDCREQSGRVCGGGGEQACRAR